MDRVVTGIGHFDARSVHALRRAAERYGFEMDRETLATFRSRITTELNFPNPESGCVHLWQQKATLSHWAIWHGGEWVLVVYDEAMRSIVTLLPKYHLRNHKRLLPW